jgi:hypothetical protein
LLRNLHITTALLTATERPPLLATSDWLQWFQRLTMSEGTGPRSAERHCADSDRDYRFSDDEEPQSRHKHEEAA